MESEQFRPRSHLFTVGLWLEPLGNGQTEWRGKVQHVLSGEARYIRDWAALCPFVERRLQLIGGEREPPAEDLC